MKSENKISILLLALSIILPVLFIMLFIHDNEKIEKISLDEATELSMVTEYGIENIIVDNTNIFLYPFSMFIPPHIFFMYLLYHYILKGST